ncbi:hypothetical protein [Novosphingobium jiangmenense]|uniref:Uncharacterized protein n=1 Tax=Novosphingobium jiangmenense TaxID=2791981 RepID=A0ABS0HK05_9SPHN|nr:hypothetical protein [Novosphingobium jiangmenense]MBF9152587.1 hypothetical protein [Novosphingobium jiangmenense]
MISVFSIAFIGLMFLAAVATRFFLSRRRPMLVRTVWVLLAVLPLPGFAWWMTFNSPGSGWGFALIAMFLTIALGLGIIGGLIWYAVSARAPR